MVLQCSDAEESGIGALSGNRFGDKSLGFQCGGGGRTNGGDRLGPRVLVELEAAEVQLSGGIVGELSDHCGGASGHCGGAALLLFAALDCGGIRRSWLALHVSNINKLD